MAAADIEARFCPRHRNEIKKRTRHWQRSPAADINTLLCTGRQVNRYFWRGLKLSRQTRFSASCDPCRLLTCRPDQISAWAFARSVTKNKTVMHYKPVLVAIGKPAVCPRLAGLSPGTVCPRVMTNARGPNLFFLSTCPVVQA
jgi:ferredoxin-thioredoxin reductase catalytic subunit